MGPFLRGFYAELTKLGAVGDPSTSVPPVPASGAPTGNMRPPSSIGLASIKPQVMRWGETKPKADLWRPSPKVKLQPEPTGPDKVVGGGGRKRSKSVDGRMIKATVPNPGMSINPRQEKAYQASPDRATAAKFYSGGGSERMSAGGLAPAETPRLKNKAQGAGYMQQQQYNQWRMQNPTEQRNLGLQRVQSPGDMLRYEKKKDTQFAKMPNLNRGKGMI